MSSKQGRPRLYEGAKLKALSIPGPFAGLIRSLRVDSDVDMVVHTSSGERLELHLHKVGRQWKMRVRHGFAAKEHVSTIVEAHPIGKTCPALPDAELVATAFKLVADASESMEAAAARKVRWLLSWALTEGSRPSDPLVAAIEAGMVWLTVDYTPSGNLVTLTITTDPERGPDLSTMPR